MSGDTESNRGRFGWRLPAVALATVAMMGLAACGDEDQSTAASGGATAAKTADKAPLKIYNITVLSGPLAPVFIPWQNSAEATAAQINAAGGVDGHKIEVVGCDTAATASGSAACGRKAVKDEAIGVINFSPFSTYLPVVEQAQIPVAHISQDPAELKASVAYSPTIGTLVTSAGLAAYGKYDSCKKMVYVVAGLGGDQVRKAVADQFKTAADDMGIAHGEVRTDSLPDMSPVVANALKQNPDCLAFFALGPDMVGLLKAVEASGSKVQVYAPDANLPPALVKSVGKYAETVRIASAALPASATTAGNVAKWLEATDKFGKAPRAYDSNGATQWAFVTMFADAAKTVTDPTDAKSVLKAISEMADLNTGVTPPVSFDKPARANPYGPHAFQQYEYLHKFENGKAVLAAPNPVSILDGTEATPAG